MSENGVEFPGKKAPAPLPVPPVHDLLSGGDMICPFIPATLAMMPVIENSHLLKPGQQPGAAFVRHFTPCVKAKCMAWHSHIMMDGSDVGGCSLVPAKS